MLAKYKIIAVVLLLASCFYAGYEWNDRAWSEKVAKAENERTQLTLEVERMKDRNSWLIMDSVNDILEDQEAEAEVIYREKIVYRDSPGAGTCKFPANGVQIINRAAGVPPVPEAPATAQAEQKPITDIEVVGVVTKNYQLCRKEMAKYQGLWDWAEALYNVSLK